MWCFKINNRAVATAQQTVAVDFVENDRCIADVVSNTMESFNVQGSLKKKILFLLLFFIAVAGLFAKGNVDSEMAKAYFEIAQAYAEVSKYDKAVEFYLKAAKDPAHKNAVDYNLARVYGLQGDWIKAKPILERQYKEAPGNVLILKAYAYSLAATGDEERACAMYKKLYDEDSENPEAALNYARMQILAKRYDEATSFIEDLKARFTESAENRALAELEEKIKKAQEEPEKQEKEVQDQNDNMKDKNDATDSAEKQPEKADPKAVPNAAKPSADMRKGKEPQTKLPTDTGNDKGVTAKSASVNSTKSVAGAEPAEVKKKDGTKK